MFLLRTLGDPELIVDGVPVRLHRKNLGLLSFLFIESGRPHSRSYLSELLWPELPENRSDNNLRQSLHILRKNLDSLSSAPVILSTSGQIRLAPEFLHAVDASPFFHPPAGCPAIHDPADCRLCRTQLTKALQAIRGPFLNGLFLPECEEFDHWVTGKREELIARSRWALDRIFRLLEKENRSQEGISLLEHFLKLDPFDEEIHRALMTLLWKTGNRKGAERQYAFCLKILKTELDVEPEPETRELLERIRSEQGSPVLSDRSSPPVARSEPAIPESPLLFEWRQATALYLDIHSTEALGDSFIASPLLGGGSRENQGVRRR